MKFVFASGVKPTRIAGRLTKAEIASLWHATQDLIKRAIEARGTTFNSYVDGEGGREVQQLCVYGKGGKPCLRCGILLKDSPSWPRDSILFEMPGVILS